MTSNDLATVADRLAVSDVLHRYATAIDTKNFDLLNQVFDERVATDFTSFGGKKVEVTRGEWIDAVRRTVGGLDATQHLTANHVHEIAGDRAHLTAYIQAMHHLNGARGEPDYVIGGTYEIDLVRRAAGWRISRYSINVTWQRGDRDVLRQAAKRLAA